MEVRKESLIKRFNLDKAALIEASAGTGKTFTITYLVLRLLLGSGQDNQTYLTKGHGERFGPLPLENILIVTFSETCHFSSYNQIFYHSVLMANIFDAIGQIISSNTIP